MKRIYYKPRVMLLTLALGLAAVPFVSGLSDKWSETPVNLPQIKSDSPIYVFPKEVLTESVLHNRELINQKRDLSLYDRCDCGSFEEYQKFIWEYWRSKRKGYVGFQGQNNHGEWKSELFIEPDKNGDWRIVSIRREPGRFDFLLNDEVTELTEAYSVKFKRAPKDHYRYDEGTIYLSFLNKQGQEVDSW